MRAMQGKRLTTGAMDRHGNRSNGSDFFMKKSNLYLTDGTTFKGDVPVYQKGECTGEVVFNTGMTGYVESLTDPSYAGQILVFTYPLIGNYGVDLASMESQKIQVCGVIVSEAARMWSHAGSDRSLLEWLRAQDIPILMNVDTRRLTKQLRVSGTMLGSIGVRADFQAISLSTEIVSINEPTFYNPEGKKTVIVVDCGLKESIIRKLLDFSVCIKRVPYNYDYSNEDFDGVLLSNGPGNPADYKETIRIARQVMKGVKPVFGICLGSQIMGLAGGARTYKLPYGHRGHNQPCLEAGTNHGYITSQNHGYALDESSLPKEWRVSFKNLNDGSVEGITHVSKPFFSVQFHPEANPGPTDTEYLFKRFEELL